MRAGAGSSVSERLYPRERVKVRADFVRLNETARRVHTRHFVIQIGTTPAARALTTPRLGITVTRKIANACGRNRVKRLVREVFRHERGALPGGVDLVFVARKGADTLGYEEVRDEVLRAGSAVHAAARRLARAEAP